MTDIAVFSQPYQTEDRSWLLSEFEDCYAEGGTLSVAAFVAGQHYVNGYIPSGTLLGVITTGGLLAPYLDAAGDGTNTCVGILLHSVRVLNPLGVALVKVGVAYSRYNMVVSQARLPFVVGTAAAGGYVDAAAKTDLKNVLFLA
jgi:hypothetical protein